jgi:hypothetical protein
MDKLIQFARKLVDQIENFEKENHVTVDVVRWGIGFRDDHVDTGSIIWGDPNERNVPVEYHDNKEN